MATEHYGDVSLVTRDFLGVAFLVCRPPLQFASDQADAAYWQDWDSAVASAARRGYLVMDDSPEYDAHGVEIYVITRP